jgi:hypothetical protein
MEWLWTTRTRVIRDYLAGALKHITPDALDKPTIVLALVPHWKNELCIHWVAAEPEADGVEVRLVDRQEALTFALSSYDLEQNRVQARTRVAYTNTLRSPEVEKFLDRIQAAPERPQVVVTLLTHGVPASAPARVFKWEASGSLVSLNESSTTAPTDNRMGSGSFRPK